jgi:hypothetical protein
LKRSSVFHETVKREDAKKAKTNTELFVRL